MSFELFKQFAQRAHENVSFFYCPRTKLKAIVAVHSTVLGPALGGCRIRNYDTEAAALEDVIRLSEGMTYKNAVAGMDLGGGKACIIADPKMEEGRREFFESFGKYLNRLAGSYITAEDMGARVEDMRAVKSQTPYCVGFPIEDGGSGNPSPWTALGVFRSFEGVSEQFLTKDISDLKVAVQGIGQVGGKFAKLLRERGAQVYCSDSDAKNLMKAKDEFGIIPVESDKIYDVDCDVFSPCAIGQTINLQTIARIKASCILGAANNQLSSSEMYPVLKERKLLYCPDFVVNAGGVISVGAELNKGGWQEDWVRAKIDKIRDTILNVLKRAENEGRSSEEVALQIACERIESKRNEKK